MKCYLLTLLMVLMTTVSFAINVMPPQVNAAQVTGSTTITNTIVGVGAFVSNVSGVYNTGVGVDSLASNLTGSYNTAFGNMSLKANTVGYQNTSIGNSTLMANTSGHLNTAVGNGTLYANTIGHHNSSIGDEAMFSNTSGNENNSFGYASLYSNVTTSGNSAFGNSSLGYHTTGDYNTAYGYYSGLFLSDGASPNLSSTYGLYLGYNSKALADGGSNEIVIGASTIGHGNNSTTIGNNLTEKTYLAGTVYGSGTELLHINGDNIASTAFTLKLDQNSVGMATESVEAYIATETQNRISSDSLKANTDGSNIASTAFTMLLDQTYFGSSSTVTVAELNAALATEALYRSDGDATVTANIPNNGSFTLSGLSEKSFSNLTDKPTTLAGYGITDAASITTITELEPRINYLGDSLTLSTATTTAYIPIATGSTFIAIPTDKIGVIYGTVLIKHLASDSARIVKFECDFENFDDTFAFIGSQRYTQTEVNETASLLQASPTAVLNGFRILGKGDNGTSFKVTDLCIKYL